jgi:hypothetical protein
VRKKSGARTARMERISAVVRSCGDAASMGMPFERRKERSIVAGVRAVGFGASARLAVGENIRGPREELEPQGGR